MFDVITLGSATIDFFLTIHRRLKSITYGEKVLTKHLEIHTGGGGTNSAVALSRLSLKTAYLGKLGQDHNADLIFKELKKEKVKIIPTKPSPKLTSLSVILKSEQEKDRIIYTYKGACDDLSIKDFKLTQLQTKWIYLATLLGPSFQTAKKIIDYASKRKIKILFNPSTYLARQGSHHLKKILQNTFALILNKQESQLLLHTKDNNPFYLIKQLKKLGPQIIVITHGPKTIYASDPSQIYALTPYPVKIIHTAGAGDAFNSGFLAGLIKTNNLEFALKLALVNASSVIQHYGTKNKLLTYPQALKEIKKHKIKIKTY